MKRAHSLLGEALHIIQSHQCIAKRMLSLDERTRIVTDLMALPLPVARKLVLLGDTDTRKIQRERTQRFGAFRVAYRVPCSDHPDGLVLTVAGEDDCLDEAAVTMLCSAVERDLPVSNEAWIEHQDPATGDWRKW